MDFYQAGSAFAPENYENSGQALSMDQYFDAKNDWFKSLDNVPSGVGNIARPDYSLMGRIGNFFTGSNQYLEDEYNNYLVENQRRYEQANINSARKHEEYMESTKYQRMKKDLEAAGYNPWLALQNGIGSASVSTGSHSYSTSARKVDYNKNNSRSNALSGIVNTALRLAMLALVAS